MRLAVAFSRTSSGQRGCLGSSPDLRRCILLTALKRSCMLHRGTCNDPQFEKEQTHLGFYGMQLLKKRPYGRKVLIAHCGFFVCTVVFAVQLFICVPRHVRPLSCLPRLGLNLQHHQPVWFINNPKLISR